MTGFKMKNKYLLVRPMDRKRRMANGVTMEFEENDKKSITKGTIVTCEAGVYKEGTIIVFPLYAADVYTSDDAEVLWLVKGEDVMMVECP